MLHDPFETEHPQLAMQLCDFTSVQKQQYDTETSAYALWLLATAYKKQKQPCKRLFQEVAELTNDPYLTLHAWADFNAVIDESSEFNFFKKSTECCLKDPENKRLLFLSYICAGQLCAKYLKIESYDERDIKNLEQILAQPHFKDLKIIAHYCMSLCYYYRFKGFPSDKAQRPAELFIEYAASVFSQANIPYFTLEQLHTLAHKIGKFASTADRSVYRGPREKAVNILTELSTNPIKSLQAIAWYFLGMCNDLEKHTTYLEKAAQQESNLEIKERAQKQRGFFSSFINAFLGPKT
jgi:hypothetical protein